MAVDFSNAALSQLTAFGETVTFIDDNLPDRELVHDPENGTYGAIVERERSEGLPEASAVQRPFVRVTVRCNATLGVLPAEIDTATSRFEIAERIGGAERIVLRVHRIVSQDGAAIVMELR
ncbi:MAG TPA: hypothetical protein VFH53_07290 [Phycisphaerae bacterium]|nr:hypothetical protein [Phycisphaerae bacterium]HUX14882.1 hypothetical protein [Phycisphaerae bacterium]